MSNELSSRPLSAADLGMPASKPAAQSATPARDTLVQPTGEQKSAQSQGAGNRQGNNNNRQGGNRGGRPNGQGGQGGQGGRSGGNRGGGGGRPGGPRRGRDSKANFVVGSFNQNGNGSKVVRAQTSKADAGKLKIIPLGGLGEIGKNVMALEYEDDIIVLDLGFAFPGDDQPGIDLIVPDVTYLEERKHKIRGHFITHAHEDHVGGVPFLLPKMPAPIYGAKFSIKFIERKLEEYKLPFKPDLRIVDQDAGERIQAGVFSVEFIRITHSIPDACALAIRTPLGTIIDTGDWRFEENPIDGKPSNKERLKELGDEGVLMLMSDSTNCEVVGKSPTEQGIVETLDEIMIRNYNKRAIIASFGSQVTRMQIVVDATVKAKRKLVVLGRSMVNNLELAMKLGYIKVPPGTLIKGQEMNKYQDGEIAILTTGSQGEEFSALQRMGRGEHRDVKLKENDVVILSSSIIPGNEESVWGMVDNLFRWGAYVYQSSTRDFDGLGIMHTTGHAWTEEIEEMLDLVRPKYYLPIHGELHHLVHNAAIGKRKGFDDDHVFVIENGQTLVADKEGIKKGPIVQNGIVLIDGNGIGDVQAVVLNDRKAMGSDGIFTAIATVDRKTGRLTTSPDIISRGFVYMKDNEELINKSRQIVKNIFDHRDRATPANSLVIKTRMRDELSNHLYKVTKRNPIVVPVVIEV
jgi:ribonuclease J